MKRLRRELNDAAMLQGALEPGKVVDQGMALVQKKQRLNDKKGKVVKGTEKRASAGRQQIVHKNAVDDGDDEEEAGRDEEGESEEEGSEDTEESASSGESEDINDASSQNSRGSDESEESEASQKPAAKRKSRESSDFPTKGRSKKTKFQQTFKLLLAPRSGSSTSRMATKAIEQAKKGLKELRAALIGVNTLWLQARSPSDKSSCETKFLGLGQSIYNCGVYSDKSGSRKEAMELLNKLADVLRPTHDSSKPNSAFLEIDRLCCDLKGKDSYTK